jgi:hypothetical protein
MRITFRGIPQAKRQLEKLLTLDTILQRVLTAATAERLRLEAFSRTPVRTGTLRDAGAVAVHGEAISYRNPTPYAPFVEWGTGERGARSWKDFFGSPRYYEDYVRDAYAPTFKAGWPGMKARPFARPAVVSAMDALASTLRNTAQIEIGK